MLRKNGHQQVPASIRLAQPEDTATISSLYFEWLNFGERKGRIQQIRRSIRAKELIVAVDPNFGGPIGFIQGIISNDPISSGPVVYIASFYLRKEFRRRGIGSRLLGVLLKRAIRQGAVGAEVATAQRHAFKLYKKFGFSRYRADIGEVMLGLNLKKLKNNCKLLKLLDKVEND